MSQPSLLREFDVLVADPPWKTKDKNANGKRGAHFKYPCMPTKDICRMQLPNMAANAWLFLWKIGCMTRDAYDVVEAWGFTPKTEIVWQKLTKNGLPHFGLGHYSRGSHETFVLAVRGSVKVADKGIRSTFPAKMPVEQVGLSKKGKPIMEYIHSAKPDEFYKIVERLTGPGIARVEMFGRRQRKGWVVLGDQANKYAEVA